MRWRSSLVPVLLLMIYSGSLWAYPNSQRTSLSLGIASPTFALLDGDNHRIYAVVGENFYVIDLGTFALSTRVTPYSIATDDDFDGSYQGIVVDSAGSRVFATQEGGKLLRFDLSDLATEPTQTILAADKELTKIAYDTNGGRLYILNETDRQILRHEPGSETVETIQLGAVTDSFTVADMVFVPGISGSVGALYVTTSVGKVFVLSSTSSAAQAIMIDVAGQDNLKGVTAHPTSSTVYVVNASEKTIHTINTSSNSVALLTTLSQNSDLDAMAVAEVTNPTDTFGFVVGSSGLSVFDLGTGVIEDLGSDASVDDEPLTLSGVGRLLASEDGYIYNVSSSLGIITDNPLVTISSVTYSSGGTSLGKGETVTITFQADEVGTYDMRVGGTVEKDGAVLLDDTGASTGTVVTASADQSVTIAYDDNAANFEEDVNAVFIFVADAAGNEGRRATTVTVDTPPPAVTIQSIGFGNEKLFVNIDRLSQTDIATYQVYVDIDASAVGTSTSIAATTGQPDAGSDAVVEVTGLTNGTTYFVAAEAVDTAGNVSETRTTTLSSGAVASAIAEATFGPAGLAGEAGCTLIPPRRKSLRNPEHWSLEWRGGIFQPTGTAMKQFFPDCCSFQTTLTGGVLIDSKYGIDLGVGFHRRTGFMRGILTSTQSQEQFSFLLLPVRLEGTYRADYLQDQTLVPYAKGGLDVLYFRENDAGRVLQGYKTGLHGGGGVMILLNALLEGGLDLEYGLNDVFFVVDGRYQWADNFGSTGLDLSGWLVSGGIHLQF